jgi:hypothetical protein
MTRTEELLALAEAATSPYADDWELKQALLKFDRAANPTTIKQLVELVRLQHEALDTCDVGDVKYPDDTQFYDDHKVEKAIEAFNKWDDGK